MAEKNSNALEKIRLARDPDRPYTNDIIRNLFDEFVELHGDRRFADDPAIVSGFGKIDEIEVAIIGQQKGRDTNQRRYRNFGMPKPEGYRKALRVLHLAEKFRRPVITLIDTPGAYPGIDAEERGQAEAIALNLREMSGLKVPLIIIVLGEGGSGGALAIGVGDYVYMFENAVYSVITPEGCAAILWKDSGQSARAAECLKLTADDLKSHGLIDDIIKEKEKWIVNKKENNEELDPVLNDLKLSLIKTIKSFENIDEQTLLAKRYERLRKMGNWEISR